MSRHQFNGEPTGLDIFEFTVGAAVGAFMGVFATLAIFFCITYCTG